MWLPFGWIPLILVRISIFFNSGITEFVRLSLEIAHMSLYRCIAFSLGIIPANADRASRDTVL